LKNNFSLNISFNEFKHRLRRPQGIALALGGGGSKGSAHIGVLRVLERENIRIEALAGSSIGGLVAAVYAVGNNAAAIEKRMSALQTSSLLRSGSKAPNALMGLDGIAHALEDILGDRRFEDLDIPLALTALDLVTCQEVVLREGRLVDAVLATIAIPGIFPIQKMNGYELVDGGMSNPVPVAVARSLAPRLPVVASVLSQPTLAVPSSNGNGAKQNGLNALPLPGPLMRLRLGRSFMAFMNALSVSGRVQTELRIGLEKPDIVIRPDVEHVGLLDSVDVADLARRGEEATLKVLPDLRRMLKRARWFSVLPRKAIHAS
jgi:NTE family protein